MSWRATRWSPPQPGPRHSPDWYDQTGEEVVLDEGDRILLPCDGGPCTGRAEIFPPRLEIPDHGGTYVLIDIGPRASWVYQWIPAT